MPGYTNAAELPSCTNVLLFFRLQNENDKLVGKHSQHSQELQNEIINLPDNMEVHKDKPNNK